MTAHITDIAPAPHRAAVDRGTPEQVLASIVDGINTGNLDALMSLYESGAAFATQPGSLAHGLHGIRGGLAGFIAMKGTLNLKVTRVLEASGLALVIGVWSFAGTGPDGQPVSLTGHNADRAASSIRRLLAFRDRQPLGNGLTARAPIRRQHDCADR